MSGNTKKKQKKLTKLQRRLLNSRKDIVLDSAIDSICAIVNKSNPTTFKRVGGSLFWTYDDENDV